MAATCRRPVQQLLTPARSRRERRRPARMGSGETRLENRKRFPTHTSCLVSVLRRHRPPAPGRGAGVPFRARSRRQVRDRASERARKREREKERREKREREKYKRERKKEREQREKRERESKSEGSAGPCSHGLFRSRGALRRRRRRRLLPRCARRVPKRAAGVHGVGRDGRGEDSAHRQPGHELPHLTRHLGPRRVVEEPGIGGAVPARRGCRGRRYLGSGRRRFRGPGRRGVCAARRGEAVAAWIAAQTDIVFHITLRRL